MWRLFGSQVLQNELRSVPDEIDVEIDSTRDYRSLYDISSVPAAFDSSLADFQSNSRMDAYGSGMKTILRGSVRSTNAENACGFREVSAAGTQVATTICGDIGILQQRVARGKHRIALGAG